MSYLCFCLSKLHLTQGGSFEFYEPDWRFKANVELSPNIVASAFRLLDVNPGNRLNDWGIGFIDIKIEGPRDDTHVFDALNSDTQVFIFSMDDGWRSNVVSSIPPNQRNKISQIVGHDAGIQLSDTWVTAIEKLFIAFDQADPGAQVPVDWNDLVTEFNNNNGTSYAP